MPHRLDILGIGNAIVDILAQADDALLAELALPKGGMTLIDEAGAAAVHARMGPVVRRSGGSCANTVTAAAALGASVAYVGKVRDDELGRLFARDIRAAGVRFTTPPAADARPTARCHVLVTPDAQRTMATYLGACVELGPGDLDEALVASAALTYVEGYLWDEPEAKRAVRRAMDVARAAGGTVALSLSDPFCVERHREELLALVRGSVDVLLANEEEAVGLFRTAGLDEAVEAARRSCAIAAVTRGPRGAVAVRGGETVSVPAFPVDELVDSTGAGDLFAAGFLTGLVAGDALERCARTGAAAAAEILGRFGARHEGDLAAAVAARLGPG